MGKIKSVSTCVADGPGLLGTLLDVHFQNGQSLLLSLQTMRNDPVFLHLYQDGGLFFPKTDGNVVYWQDGPRLTIAEMMELARRRS
jgi:hypothetical protein